MAEQETFRLLLQNTMERNDGLVRINHEMTIAIPTILGIVWGVVAGLTSNSNVIVYFAIITISILLLWRYFAHYIDDDIAGNYSKILQLEKNLEIPIECSIYPGVLEKISKKDESHKKGKIEDVNIKLIDQLWKEKQLGYRGHDKWDKVAFVLIFLFFGLFNIVHIWIHC